MENNSLIEKYKKSIINEYGDLTLILYGSMVYGINTSDLDICIFSKNKLSKQRFDNLKKLTRLFHLENGLRIDEEVPYDNKLVYSDDNVKMIFNNPPFPYVENKFLINPVLKSKEFLSSSEMSKRLLLNILTVRHDIIFGNEMQVSNLTDKAWELMLRVVLSYAEKNEVTIDELLNLLYEDPYTHATGELYLGYKNNLQEKMYFLESSIANSLNKLEDSQIVTKTLKKRYRFNEDWIKNGTKN